MPRLGPEWFGYEADTANVSSGASVIECIKPVALPSQAFPFDDHTAASHELLGLPLLQSKLGRHPNREKLPALAHRAG
jgi:hypothetical protein